MRVPRTRTFGGLTRLRLATFLEDRREPNPSPAKTGRGGSTRKAMPRNPQALRANWAFIEILLFQSWARMDQLDPLWDLGTTPILTSPGPSAGTIWGC